jgi:5-methylcytosine-specific restriction endonuclease McrA
MPSDFKRGPRLRDPDALARFRLENLNEPCEQDCGRVGVEVHHRNYRSRGGSDVPENFAWVCRVCHRAAHKI